MRFTEAFPDGRFGAPVSAEAIAAAEAKLGERLPADLAALYLEADGFREPKGNAPYLLPLSDLVETTLSMRRLTIPGVALPDFSPFLFFGIPSGNGWWGVRVSAPHDVIAWDHPMLQDGPVLEQLGTDIIEIMKADFALYDDVEIDA